MVLLVVDTQKGITDDRLYNFESLRTNIKRLIYEARNHHVEIVYVRHDDGPGTGFSLGDEEFEIFEEFAPKGQERIFDKTVNSAFDDSTGLVKYLAEKKEKKIMVVGLQTNFCIDATVKSAFERGYKVIIPQGANSTFDNDYMNGENTYKYYNNMMWPKRFAACISVDETIKMLEEK